jgi:hypothetical protein
MVLQGEKVMEDREISYQCALKKCPECGDVTESTTSVCENKECDYQYFKVRQ